jgi:hypothetical protein
VLAFNIRIRKTSLTHHKSDYWVYAEHHFYVTSHGKGPCDGLCGTVKRLACQASLKRPYDQQINTANRLYNWALTAFTNVTYDYVSVQQYNEAEKKLRKLFSLARLIPGTLKYHAAIPLSETEIEMKRYSSSSKSHVYTIQ